MTKKQIELAEKVKSELLEIAITTDTETGHQMADESLCKLLKELGFNEVVEMYYRVDKWYA